jgi:hypothetical protein
MKAIDFHNGPSKTYLKFAESEKNNSRKDAKRAKFGAKYFFFAPWRLGGRKCLEMISANISNESRGDRPVAPTHWPSS